MYAQRSPDSRHFFCVQVRVLVASFHAQKKREHGMRTRGPRRKEEGKLVRVRHQEMSKFGLRLKVVRCTSNEEQKTELTYVSFMLVAATVRALLPSSIRVIISS